MSDIVFDIHVISDSTGETGENYAKSLTAQFPDVKNRIIRHSDINSCTKVDDIIDDIKDNSIIIATIANRSVSEYLTKKTKDKKNLEVLDILGSGLERFEKVTGHKALRERGLTRKLSDDYFSMIEAVEFAVKYDDGKDPRGLLGADIVLIGVSRTSKTPLSMLLATKNYKVCNLPLVPEIQLPNEIFEVDPRRIMGLIINENKLSSIREERSKIMGLGSKSSYFEQQRILEELKYAKEVFKDLDCKVIDVTDKTIEQTATKIISYYKEIENEN
ncbi:MAG: pyruvate, water dikinase regulatory protein [Tissierellia bacterium]|nr:pyruvate, water dikinase regulatory protein [Tissierellia bacterium]